jgi:hypothetical protein
MEDTTRTFEKFQDQIATVHMYEFKVIDDCEVDIIGYEPSGKGFVERHCQSIREVIERWEHTDQLVSDAEELCGALDSIVLDGNVDQGIEDDDSESTADQQCAEDDRIQQMLLATRSALDDLAQQSELLDTSIRETAVALQELEASLGPQIAALESEVVQMKTDACKEDFAHSVELGKKTDAMNRASQQLREEQHTAQSIQGESSELRRALESLQQALSQQRDRERTAAEQYLSLDKETNALHETAAVTKERIAQLTSEVQSARCLIQTCEAQSFLERATTLLSDVTAAQEAGEAKKTELQYVQRQVRKFFCACSSLKSFTADCDCCVESGRGGARGVAEPLHQRHDYSLCARTWGVQCRAAQSRSCCDGTGGEQRALEGAAGQCDRPTPAGRRAETSFDRKNVILK